MLQISEEEKLPEKKLLSITRYYNNRTVDEPYITAEFPAEEFKENFVVGDGTLFPTGNKRRKRAGEIYSRELMIAANYNCARVINVLNHTGRFSKVKRILNFLNENNTLRCNCML